jgi:hypothetical protein
LLHFQLVTTDCDVLGTENDDPEMHFTVLVVEEA